MARGFKGRSGFDHYNDHPLGDNVEYFRLRSDRETFLDVSNFIKEQGWVKTEKHNAFQENGIEFHYWQASGDNNWLGRLKFTDRSKEAAAFKLFFGPIA